MFTIIFSLLFQPRSLHSDQRRIKNEQEGQLFIYKPPTLSAPFVLAHLIAIMEERRTQVQKVPKSDATTTKNHTPSLRISQTDRIRRRHRGSSTCVIHILPPEIRTMIYELCLKSRHVVGWHPGLLQALRPDKTLYNEALEMYYRVNIFELNKNNSMTFRNHAPPRLLDNVKDLVLDTRYAALLPLLV